MKYVGAADARNMPGLRLALTVGLPGPWGESAKKIFEYKGISYVPVAQYASGANEDLVAWTGHRNVPVAVWEGEPGRANYLDIVALAERLEPEPTIIRETRMIDRRVLVFRAIFAARGDGVGSAESSWASDHGTMTGRH